MGREEQGAMREGPTVYGPHKLHGKWRWYLGTVEETPNDGGTTQEEPTPSAEGRTPPTILLLAPNGHKHATRTVQQHHAPWSIP